MASEDCICCGGTGLNSKGGSCRPCENRRHTAKAPAKQYQIGTIVQGEIQYLELRANSLEVLLHLPPPSDNRRYYIFERTSNPPVKIALWKEQRWALRKTPTG